MSRNTKRSDHRSRAISSYDETAESKALAAVLINRTSFDLALEMFSQPARRAIFSAATSLPPDTPAEAVADEAGRLLNDPDAVGREIREVSGFDLWVDRPGESERAARRVRQLHSLRMARADFESLSELHRRGESTTEQLAMAAQALATAERMEASDALVFVDVSSVTERSIEWLWEPRIAVGKLCLFAGVPECGKSLVTCDIAARVSTGTAWPDGAAGSPPGSVLMFLAEDDVADTVKPRLRVAGADLSRIACLDTATVNGQRLPFDLDRDLPKLRAYLLSHPEIRLLIIDPINSFLSRGTDSHNDASVRQSLGPLRELAEHYRVAILLVTHSPKVTNGPAVNRAMGSLAFVGLTRSAFLFAADPSDPNRRLMLRIKNNLAAKVPGLAFRTEPSPLGGAIPCVVWDREPVDMTADDLIQAERKAESLSRESALERATDWLMEFLSTGPRRSADAETTALEAGLSTRSVERARATLNVETRKVGRTFWMALPGGFADWSPPEER